MYPSMATFFTDFGYPYYFCRDLPAICHGHGELVADPGTSADLTHEGGLRDSRDSKRRRYEQDPQGWEGSNEEVILVRANKFTATEAIALASITRIRRLFLDQKPRFGPIAFGGAFLSLLAYANPPLPDSFLLLSIEHFTEAFELAFFLVLRVGVATVIPSVAPAVTLECLWVGLEDCPLSRKHSPNLLCLSDQDICI